MKLEKLHIKNYKSLVDLEIVKPNPFTVFAGANGAGKSNIFEALEFAKFLYEMRDAKSVVRLFDGKESIKSRSSTSSSENSTINCEFSDAKFIYDSERGYSSDPNLVPINGFLPQLILTNSKTEEEATLAQRRLHEQFVSSFNRIFIKNRDLVKVIENSEEILAIDCANLEKVLKRILNDEIKQEDITEYLEMMIPGFEKIEVYTDSIGGKDTLLIYEIGIEKPFTKDLISDGTYNIICLLTALFQSDEPQFLCIEEPENGLNPYVVQEFVELCRLMCEDYGHYIWLNTHSQTLVRALKEQELILVDKENGATKIKQFEKGSFHGLLADDAWLMNALGAGIPW